jgi:DNA-directed RNA polymerase subunit alpha
MVATTAAPRLDVREMITGNGPFGPTEIRRLVDGLGSDPGVHRDLRAAVRELESQSDRSPAAAVKLGVCQFLLGRGHEALDTLRTGDGGALALFYQGLAHAAQQTHDKARESFEAARNAGYDAGACAAGIAEALRASGKSQEARREIEQLGPQAEASAAALTARGLIAADLGHPVAESVAAFEKALTVDPGHPEALFALGVINDRLGNDAEARDCYERSLKRYPQSVGALLNLGIMFEDDDDFTRAQQCYRRILEVYPDHPRARLFMRDSSASGDLHLDEQEQRQRDRLDQVMQLPVSDFELSVRSRNCLQKMGILTLGDLARTTEDDILASKNFGETSLHEIKDMLASKGLSLGQAVRPIAAGEPEPEPLEAAGEDLEINSLPINELNLSVRARKCTTKLGINTIGDLVRRTAEDLLECKNFGVTSLNEVREKLTERGLKLRGE